MRRLAACRFNYLKITQSSLLCVVLYRVIRGHMEEPWIGIAGMDIDQFVCTLADLRVLHDGEQIDLQIV